MDGDKMTPLAPLHRRRTGRASLSMATPSPSLTPVATIGDSGRNARRGRASLGVSAQGRRDPFHDDDSPWLGGRGDSPSTALSPAPSTRGETSAFRRAEELWKKAAKAREGSRRRSVGAAPLLERRLSWRGEEGEEDRRRGRPDEQQQQQQSRVGREEVPGNAGEAHGGRGAVARSSSVMLDGIRGGAGGVSVASEVPNTTAQAGSSIAGGAALQGEGGDGGGTGEKGTNMDGMDRDAVRVRMLAIYLKYAPEKLANVDEALIKYEGRWGSMLQRVEDKYISKTGLPPASGTGPTCFMDIEVGGEPVGRLVLVLFADKTPKAAENFRALCTGEKGPGLRYEGSAFHRIIPGFVVQGGDFTTGDGRGGKSIYGDKFEDEPFMRHYKPGLLSMANKGKNTNNSQFFITLKAVPHLDGKHVVFGEMISGIRVLDCMKAATLLEPKSEGKPAPDQRVVISRCGQLKADGTEVRCVAAPAMPFSAGTGLFGLSNLSTAPATTPVFSPPLVVGPNGGGSIFGGGGSVGDGHASASFAIPSSGTAPLFGTPSAPRVQPACSTFGANGGSVAAGGRAAPPVSLWSQSTGGAAGAPSVGGISSGFGKGGGLFGSTASRPPLVPPVGQSTPERSRASGGDGCVQSNSKTEVSAPVQSAPEAAAATAASIAVSTPTRKVVDSHRAGGSGGEVSRRYGESEAGLNSVASSFASLAAAVAAGPPAAAAPAAAPVPPALAEKGGKAGSPAPRTGYFAVSPDNLNATAIRVAAAATSPASTGKRPGAQRAPGGAAGAAFDRVDDAGTGWVGQEDFEVLVGIAGLPYEAEEHGRVLLELCAPRLPRARFLEWYSLARKKRREAASPGGASGARSRASFSPGGANTVVARGGKVTAVEFVSPEHLEVDAAVASASPARVAPQEDASGEVDEDGASVRSSDDEGDEEERREERTKAETAFDKVADAGKTWVEESQFEALMEGVGTTYSVEHHKPKLLSISRVGRLEKEAFLTWYDEWLFGEDDSSDEEGEVQGASSSIDGKTKRGMGFASLLKSQAGGWKCDACLVSNPESTLKCLSCETIKPGQEGKAALSAGGGAFGTSFASKGAVNAFTFGTSPATTVTAPTTSSVLGIGTNAVGGFTFGVPVPTGSPLASDGAAVVGTHQAKRESASAVESSDENSGDGDEEERREERAKAQTAFSAVAGAGKSWIVESQFEALMEGVGTTYSVEDHKPKLLSISRAGRLEKEVFLTWYDEWLFGEDDSSDEEETGGGGAGTGGNTKPGMGFASLLKSQAGGWRCDACLVSNPESAFSRCLSCETVKPGQEGKAAVSAEGAAFGASSASNGAANSFTFGSSPTTTAMAPTPLSVLSAGTNAPGGFTFGAPVPTGSPLASDAAAVVDTHKEKRESASAVEISGDGSSSDGDEEERREERAKAQTAFSAVAGAGKSWIVESQFEALMEGVGTTYSVEDHKPKLLSISRAGKLEKEAFVGWYDEWLFGEDDSSDEEGEVQGASAGTSGNTKPGTGFASLLKSQAGGWRCDACLVSNPESMWKCLSCETVKPGQEGKVAAPTVGGGARFGGNAFLGNGSAAKGFTFGSPPAVTAAAPTSKFLMLGAGTNAAGGFTFGGPVPTESPLASDAAAAVGTDEAKQESTSAIESSGDENSSDGDEEERREERAKAQTAFSAVAGAGKSWIVESQFEALMEGVGTTYSVEDHKPKLLSISRVGKLEKEAFVAWYDEWLFGEDDSSDEEEETGGGGAGTGGNTKPGMGFASLLKSQAGGWRCDACLVSNPESALLKCLSCETVKPGQEGKAVVSVGGGAFGASSTSNGAAKSFTFGSSPTTTAIAPTTSSVLGAGTNAPGGFTFGAPVPTGSPLASDAAAAVGTDDAKRVSASTVEDSGDESSSNGDEEERREERAKAETAFDKVAGVGESCVEESQFEALMEGVGTTYSVEDHKPKLLSISRAGRLEKEAFLTWYDEWLFGEDDSSVEEEETGGGGAGTAGNATPGMGFASLLKSQAGGWRCDACLVSNPESTAKCLSCETVKPGGKGEIARSTGGASFGSFGGATSGGGKPPGGFAFGTPGASVSASTTTSVPSAGKNAAGNYSFRSSLPTASASGSGTAGAAPSAARSFTFGSPPVSTVPENAAAFGVARDTPAPTAPTPDTAASSSSTTVATDSVGGFSFGAVVPVAPSPAVYVADKTTGGPCGASDSESDSNAPEEEQARHEDRVKARAAFDAVDVAGKGWVDDGQFRVLMEGTGMTYSVPCHLPALLSICVAGQLHREAFVTWYDDWVCGDDDSSSDVDEEGALENGSTAASGKSNPRMGFSSLLKSQAGGWKCGACLVSNPESTLKCLSCEIAKPGVQQKAAEAAVAPSLPSAVSIASRGFTFRSPVAPAAPAAAAASPSAFAVRGGEEGKRSTATPARGSSRGSRNPHVIDVVANRLKDKKKGEEAGIEQEGHGAAGEVDKMGQASERKQGGASKDGGFSFVSPDRHTKNRFTFTSPTRRPSALGVKSGDGAVGGKVAAAGISGTLFSPPSRSAAAASRAGAFFGVGGNEVGGQGIGAAAAGGGATWSEGVLSPGALQNLTPRSRARRRASQGGAKLRKNAAGVAGQRRTSIGGIGGGAASTSGRTSNPLVASAKEGGERSPRPDLLGGEAKTRWKY